MNRRPCITWGICGAALLASLMPGLGEMLVYHREALLRGQVWRVLTGHLVHFSSSHLLCNLIAFTVTGWLVERRHGAPRAFLFAGVPALISIALLAEPEMVFYGGLSGLVTALVVYLALEIHQRARLSGAILLTAVVLKTGSEWMLGRALFAALPEDGMNVATLSHVAGGLLGWLAYQKQRSAHDGRSLTNEPAALTSAT